MARAIPTVMVSSTFFDLRQIRVDLLDFIGTQMGYTPLLSETASFPIDPTVDTIENCRKRVEQNADILVLLIGGRYGSVDKATSRSVTNLEYLTARAKGIPIYAFVQRDVLAVLPTWRSNPNADFSSAVADVRVFEFIEQVRTVHRVWTNEFDTAQQIIASLRVQFAHLLTDGLVWARRLKTVGASRCYEVLSGSALRIALEEPAGWEYQLLFQVVLDEIETRSSLRREHELGLAKGSGSHLSAETLGSWSEQRMSELRRLVHDLNVLFTGPIQDAVGPRGQPGSPEKIIFVARQIGAAYEEALRWAQRVRSTAAGDSWSGMLVEMSKFADGIIPNIEKWAKDGMIATDSALARPVGSPSVPLELNLTVGLGGDIAAFHARLGDLAQQFRV